MIMNSKSVYKYQLNDIKKPILVFYLVIACLFALVYLGVATTLISVKPGFNMDSKYRISGFEFNTIVFLFVCGLNMFRETFRLSMQNGVPRKTIWTGTVLTFLTVGGGMALIDTVICFVAVNFITPQFGLRVGGLYELMYEERSIRNSMAQNFLEGFLLNICLYTAALAIGYFFTIGYYRMNKIAKIIVSIGVPVFIIIVLPILITRVYGDTCPSERYYYDIGSGLLVSAVFLGLTYLMIRKVPIKD